MNFNYRNNQYNSVIKIKVNKCQQEENHYQVEISKSYKKYIQKKQLLNYKDLD